MMGAIHSAEPVWANGQATPAKELRVGDEVESYGLRGLRRARVRKVTHGSGKGTIWLHGASGAQIRCLHDERVAISVEGRRRYLRASAVRPGDFLLGMISGVLCVDPVVAIRMTVESVPAVYLEIPSISLISEEGLLCRPS